MYTPNLHKVFAKSRRTRSAGSKANHPTAVFPLWMLNSGGVCAIISYDT